MAMHMRVGFLTWVLTTTLAAAAGRGPSGPDLIIPQPRDMKILGAARPLAGARIVLTSNEPKLLIGAQELNQRLRRELKADVLPVVNGGLAEVNRGMGVTFVLGVAGQGTMPAIRRAYPVQVPAKHEGYGIATHMRGTLTVVVLCGHDAQGALYAAVTCRHLLETPGGAVAPNGSAQLHPVIVQDWPDFPWRQIGHPPSTAGGSAWSLLRAKRKQPDKLPKIGAEFIAENKRYVDFMLRHKINLSWTPVVHLFRGNGEEIEYMKAVADYARARGVYFTEKAHTNIGTYPRDKDDPRKSRCVDHRVHKSYFCWSLLDLHEERARRMADLMKRGGIPWLYLHATDGGGWENPGKWNDRCEHCRRKYGNDHAAADNAVFGTYYRIIKESIPDFKLIAVVYPYSGNKIDPELLEKEIVRQSGKIPNARELAEKRSAELTGFMSRLSKLMPPDIYVCQREVNARRYALMTRCYGKHRNFQIYMEHKPGHGWNPEFSIGSAVLKTFLRPGYQDVYYSPDCSWGINYESEMMAARYGWHANASGSRMMGDRHGGSEITRHIEPRDVALKCIARVANDFYGPEIGPYMGPVYDSNISYKFILRPQTFVRSHNLTNAPAMMREMETATERALASIEKGRAVYESARKAGRDPFPTELAAMRFGELYRALVVSRYVSQYQSRMLAAKPAVIAGDMDKAKRLMSEARAIVEQGRKAWAQRVDWMRKNPCTPRRNPNYVWTFGRFYEWDYAPLEEELAKFEKDMDSLFERYNAPKWFKAAIQKRSLYAVPCAEPPKIDGRLTEPAWQTAFKNEHFVNYKTSTPAERETEGRLLYDDTGLYVGFTAYDPGADRIKPTTKKREDHGWNQSHSVELFLDTNSDQRTYLHYIWGADESFLDSRKKEGSGGRLVMDGTGFTSKARYAVARYPDRWTVEAWIPTDELGRKPKKGASWRANLCRNLMRSDGKRESASTVVLGGSNFHTPEKFAELKFLKDVPPAPEPIINFEVTKQSAQGVTIADGTGYEVVVDLSFDTTRPLHDATLRIEAYSGNVRKAVVFVFEKQNVQLLYRTRTPVCVLANTPEPGLELDFVLTSREGSWTFRRAYGEPKPRALKGSFVPGISGQALAGTAHFPALHGGGTLFDSRQGTLEMWVRSERPRAAPPRFGPGPPRFLFFQGPVRWSHPTHDNHSAVSLKIAKKRLNGVLSTGQFQSVTASAATDPFADGGWHHVAAQWSALDPKRLRFDIYIDGKRASGSGKPNLRDRDWRKDTERFFVQLGSAITGAGPLGWAIDEVRVSSAPRYSRSFTPAKQAELDRKATVVFHFDGNLNGQVRGGPSVLAMAGPGGK